MNAAAQPVYQFRALKLSWSSGCQLWSNWLPATWQGLQPEMERGKKWLGIVGFTQDANSNWGVLVENLVVDPTLSFWPFLLNAKRYLLDSWPEPKVDIWQHGLRDFGQLFVPSLWPWADFWADWKVTITLLFGSKVFDSYISFPSCLSVTTKKFTSTLVSWKFTTAIFSGDIVSLHFSLPVDGCCWSSAWVRSLALHVPHSLCRCLLPRLRFFYFFFTYWSLLGFVLWKRVLIV